MLQTPGLQSTMIINQKILEADITNIINTFERLMDESNKSIIPVKSRHVDGLALFENMYIRARSKHASLLGKPVLVVSSVSVFITNQGCFSTLLSHLKAHCKNKSYLLKIESVISQELRNSGDILPGKCSHSLEKNGSAGLVIGCLKMIQYTHL